MKAFKIGEVANMVGLTPKTIRFYEDSGVLTGINRSENGYRSYSQEIIEELKLLKYARDLGLPLNEIKKLMKGCENGDCDHSEEYITSTIDNYVALLKIKIRQMILLQIKLKQLRQSLKNYHNNPNTDVFCCDIFHQLIKISSRKGGGNHGRLLQRREINEFNNQEVP